MPYRLVYHPKVAGEDLLGIPHNVRARLARAIEQRLSSAPEKYGHPLRGSLKGYWKLRVGDYRVVLKVVGQEVWVLAILYRGKGYGEMEARLRGSDTGAARI